MIVEYRVALGGDIEMQVIDRQGEACTIRNVASRIGTILSEEVDSYDGEVHELGCGVL